LARFLYAVELTTKLANTGILVIFGIFLFFYLTLISKLISVFNYHDISLVSTPNTIDRIRLVMTERSVPGCELGIQQQWR